MREDQLMRASNRFRILTKVEDGKLTIKEAASFLGITQRHLRRLRKRAIEGMAGLLFHRTHKASNSVPDKEVSRILKLRKTEYLTYNITHFGDILQMRHGIKRSREFYRRLFLLHNLYQPVQRRRRKSKHRKRFEAPEAGLLIQRDTSIHFWVPGATKPWRLILDLDDHSRYITGALFSEHDDVISNMLVAWETIIGHGIPTAYYTDNNPIYNPLNKKPRTGIYHFWRKRDSVEEETLSQFKRSLHELGVEMIHATPYQPQGKGKIERIFRFMQDRLVKEMITAKVTTIDEANKYLKKWIRWYNTCHVHSVTKQIPKERLECKNAFQQLPDDLDLKSVFCLKYERQVKADNTFQYEGKTYQLRRNSKRFSFAKAKVDIRIDLAYKLHVFYKNEHIGSFMRPPKYNTSTKPKRQVEDILALQL